MLELNIYRSSFTFNFPRVLLFWVWGPDSCSRMEFR